MPKINVNINNVSERYISSAIREYVATVYGESEAEDPSWNIKGLANYIANKINEKED